MGYLTDRYKNKYRLLTEYDQSTNQFSRDLNGNFCDYDIYISCQRDIRVFYYGKAILNAVIPSIGMGMNIVRQIYALHINPSNATIETKDRTIGNKIVSITNYKVIDEDLFYEELKSKDNIIFNIEITDAEVSFLFKVKDDDIILPLFKPKTSGASISPFSVKNLPKADYTIPEEDLKEYKRLVEKLPKNEVLKVGKITSNYINTLTTKKNPISKIKDDMKLKMLKSKEYIHSIGKWEEYLKYLDKEVKEVKDVNKRKESL